jgi:hypothetical protein
MCYCGQTLKFGACENWGCHPYTAHPFKTFPTIVTTEPAPYTINLNAPVTPIHASTLDKISDVIIEYINKAIVKNWNGETSEVTLDEILSNGYKVNPQKIQDLYANYGWSVEHKATRSNEQHEWLIFSIAGK